MMWCRDLGSVEAMSITSLVGLSVDFCIHMSEAFNHAQATWAPDADAAARSAFLQYFSAQPKGREKAKCAHIPTHCATTCNIIRFLSSGS